MPDSNVNLSNLGPEELMAEFDAGSQGLHDVDMPAVLWAIIGDIQDSYCRAMQINHVSNWPAIESEVRDYIANHYGDI